MASTNLKITGIALGTDVLYNNETPEIKLTQIESGLQNTVSEIPEIKLKHVTLGVSELNILLKGIEFGFEKLRKETPKTALHQIEFGLYSDSYEIPEITLHQIEFGVTERGAFCTYYIKDKQGIPIQSALLQVFSDNVLIDVIFSDSNGMVMFKYEINKVTDIIIKKPGYQTLHKTFTQTTLLTLVDVIRLYKCNYIYETPLGTFDNPQPTNPQNKLLG